MSHLRGTYRLNPTAMQVRKKGRQLAWPWASCDRVPLEWNRCPLEGVAPLFVLKDVWRVLCSTPLFLLQVERRPLKKCKSEAVGGPREAPGEADSGSEVTRSDDLPIIAGARESKAVTSKRAAPLKKTPLPARKPAEPLAFQGEDAATPRAPSSGSQGLGTASRRAINQETFAPHHMQHNCLHNLLFGN